MTEINGQDGRLPVTTMESTGVRDQGGGRRLWFDPEIKLEDIGFGLTRREMGSDMSTLPNYTPRMNEYLPSHGNDGEHNELIQIIVQRGTLKQIVSKQNKKKMLDL